MDFDIIPHLRLGLSDVLQKYRPFCQKLSRLHP